LVVLPGGGVCDAAGGVDAAGGGASDADGGMYPCASPAVWITWTPLLRSKLSLSSILSRLSGAEFALSSAMNHSLTDSTEARGPQPGFGTTELELSLAPSERAFVY
jgi:hypothetical protein